MSDARFKILDFFDLNAEPQTLNAKPQTLNPERQTPAGQTPNGYKMSDVRFKMLDFF